MMVNRSQLEHELREAKAEIARHHDLIAELRDALAWTFARVSYPEPTGYKDESYLRGRTRYLEIRDLLNRKIG